MCSRLSAADMRRTWLGAGRRTLDEERREIMLRRNLGLTKLYNLVNDPQIADASDLISRGCVPSTSNSMRR